MVPSSVRVQGEHFLQLVSHLSISPRRVKMELLKLTVLSILLDLSCHISSGHKIKSKCMSFENTLFCFVFETNKLFKWREKFMLSWDVLFVLV